MGREDRLSISLSVAASKFKEDCVLQDDVSQTLQARADLIVADAEEEDSKSKNILQPASWQDYDSQMPQRAFFPTQVRTQSTTSAPF